MWKRPKSKYRAQRQTHLGYSFASKGELECFKLLELREKAGEIKILGVQVTTHLTRARIAYIADFKIIDVKSNQEIFVEFKGFETDVWRIKRRLWKCYGPGPLEVWKKNSKGLFLSEILVPDVTDELPIEVEL